MGEDDMMRRPIGSPSFGSLFGRRVGTSALSSSPSHLRQKSLGVFTGGIASLVLVLSSASCLFFERACFLQACGLTVTSSELQTHVPVLHPDYMGPDLSSVASYSEASWLGPTFRLVSEAISQATTIWMSPETTSKMTDARTLAFEELLATGIQVLVEIRGESSISSRSQDAMYIRKNIRDETMIPQIPMYRLFALEKFNECLFDAGSAMLQSVVRHERSAIFLSRQTIAEAVFDIGGLGELLQACLELDSYKKFHSRIRHVFGLAEMVLRPSLYLELQDLEERGLLNGSKEALEEAADRGLSAFLSESLSKKLKNSVAHLNASTHLFDELLESLTNLVTDPEFSEKVLTIRVCRNDLATNFVPILDKAIDDQFFTSRWSRLRRLRWLVAIQAEGMEKVYTSGEDPKMTSYRPPSDHFIVSAEYQHSDFFSQLPLAVQRYCPDSSAGDVPFTSRDVFSTVITGLTRDLNLSTSSTAKDGDNEVLRKLLLAAALVKRNNGIVTRHEHEVSWALRNRTSFNSWFYAKIAFNPVLGEMHWKATDFLGPLMSSSAGKHKLNKYSRKTPKVLHMISTPTGLRHSYLHKGLVFDSLAQGSLGPRSIIFFSLCKRVLSEKNLYKLHELPRNVIQHQFDLDAKYNLRPYMHVAAALWGATITDLPDPLRVPRRTQERTLIPALGGDYPYSEYAFVASFVFILKRLQLKSEKVFEDKSGVDYLVVNAPRMREDEQICQKDHLMRFMLGSGRNQIGWVKRKLMPTSLLLTNALRKGVWNVLWNHTCNVSTVLKSMQKRVVWDYGNYYDPNVKYKDLPPLPQGEFETFDRFYYSLNSIQGCPNKKALDEMAVEAQHLTSPQ